LPRPATDSSRGTSAQLTITEAVDRVVVDHPDGLHERIANRRSDEAEAARQEILAQRVGFGGSRGKISQRLAPVLDRPSANEPPDILIERSELALHPEKG